MRRGIEHEYAILAHHFNVLGLLHRRTRHVVASEPLGPGGRPSGRRCDAQRRARRASGREGGAHPELDRLLPARLGPRHRADLRRVGMALHGTSTPPSRLTPETHHGF